MANAADCCPSSSSMPPHIPQVREMENPLQTFPASPQLSTQGYNSHSQLQSPTTWSGSPVRQNSQAQSPSAEPYPQPINRYYSGSYVPHQNSDMSHYVNPASGNHQAYHSPQYPPSRQNPYTNVNHQPGYPSSLKGNYNGPYYGNVSQQAIYSSTENVNIRQSNYANSPFYPTKTAPCSNSASHHVASNNTAGAQHTAYVKQPQQQSSLYPRYAGNYAAYQQSDNQMGLSTPVTVSSSPSSSVPMITQTNGQLSSIPTPPETSGPGDLPSSEGTAIDGMADCGKVNLMSRSSFALPGSAGIQSSVSFSTSNVATTVSNSCDSSRSQSWSNGTAPIQPPPNVDEGSQASSASASSSIPEEQNSVKTNSKPNFSYPPTPNTLSSPGAASMSSFHDDLECISSPGWPRTPASPVAPTSNSYEFANIKRPESLLKLYSLSDEPDRRYFLDKLIVFNEDRGSPITQCPTISKQPLDVFRVYVAVKERGGFVEVTNAKRWKDIAGAIGVGASSSAAYTLRKQYMKLLLPYECKYDRGGIDPQPIINQVEASSRKKGKNSASGNGNMCMQGYSQAVDGYPAGYQEGYYPTSRYPCNQNNVDYCYSSNPSQYPQTVHHTTNNASMNNQSQYGQYPVNSQQTYSGYYQGNGSNSYSSNNPSPHSNVSNNICRYPSSGASQNVNIHESNYYNSNYAMQQNYPASGNNMCKYNSSSPNVNYGNSGSNSNCSNDEGVANSSQLKPAQATSYASYQGKAMSAKVNECASAPKSADSSYESTTSDISVKSESNSNSSESNFSHSYGMSKSAMQEIQPSAPSSSTTASCVTTKVTSVAPQAVPVTPIDSKPYQPNCRTTPTPPTQVSSCAPHCPTNSSTYANAPTYPNNVYQQKMLKHSGQYGQYANSPNESYRGSEGPPPPPNSVLYMGQSPTKYPAPNVSKDIPNSHPSSYPGMLSKPNTYGNSYPPMQNTKEQYPMGVYHKEVYNNMNSKAAKGWGPNSAHPYQSSDASSTISKQSNIPEKKPASEPVVPFASTETPPPPPVINRKPSVQLANSHFVSSSKMQHTAPSHCYLPNLKKPIEFPPGSVEAVKPVYKKRRRYCAKRVSPLDPWRLMLALKSGLLVESTWALDALSVLLCDNSSAVYFRLSHLPGLLSVLVEYYRRFLNKIFGLFEDLEVNAASSNKKNITSSKTKGSSKQNEVRKSSFYNWHKKSKVLESPNFTFKTRCKKTVNIRYDEALFLIDPEQKWDMFEGFDINSNYWLSGCGEITDHIQIPFETVSGKVNFARDMDKEQTGQNNQDSSSALRDFQSSHLPSCFGEPILVLKKCKIFSKFPKPEEKVQSDAENSRTSVENEGEDSIAKVSSADLKPSSISSSQKVSLDFSGINLQSPKNDSSAEKRKSEAVEVVHAQGENASSSEVPENSDESSSKRVKTESDESKEENALLDEEAAFPRLRCPTPQKRVQTDELEEEAYCLDHPSLNLMTDYQEALIRRCMCVSNILRNLSFVPGNDLEMNKNYCLLLMMGRLLLLHHEHKTVKPSHRKYDKEVDASLTAEDSCVSLRDDNEWWGNLLHVLRDNTFVIFSNIAGQLDLTPFPEEISLPILDGLLHWVTCPSSYAHDPLPAKPSLSVLTPQRLALETLCKLSVLDNNVDLMVATPPWARIERLFELLVRSLGPVEDKVVKEFAIVLLSSLSQADSSVARTIASQNQCISYLIGFIEQTESAAFQIASTQGAKKLKDNPEIVGTTPNMVLRVASILKNLALVPENRLAFFRHQQRLLTLATSQIIDQELAVIIAEVLFYCSGDDDDDILPAQFLHS